MGFVINCWHDQQVKFRSSACLCLVIYYFHTITRYYVEFGVENGDQCNTRMLREHYNFTGLLMDGGYENSYINLKREFLTVDNIVDLFRKYKVPREFDLLSIDLDMFDFWFLVTILKYYKPRLIVAEVNPTLGYNIYKQNYKHFLQSFHDLNAVPLVVNHPKTMTQRTWDGSRYSGANPLAFQLLVKEFGYKMVYCEGCGVNCFFVLESLFPESCRSVSNYPTPTIHHPCYGTGEKGIMGHKSDSLGRNPILLSTSLIRQIVWGDISQLIAENFSSHTLKLDDRPLIDRNELINFNRGDISSDLGGEADLGCDCLRNLTCESPDELIEFQMKLFLQFYELYNVVTERNNIGEKHEKSFPSYDWTCHLLLNLKNMTLCESLADLYYKKALYRLQNGENDDAKLAVAMGLKFRVQNKRLLHLSNYFSLNEFIVKSKGMRYTVTYVEVLEGSSVKKIAVGAGMCDNIRFRTQNHYKLFHHHLEIYDKIERNFFKQCLGELLTIDDGYTHIPKVVAPDEISMGSNGPHYENCNHFTSKFIHSCFSQYVFRESCQSINRLCEAKNNFDDILVFSPPFSGSDDLLSIRLGAFDDGVDMTNKLTNINHQILHALGCHGGIFSWSTNCTTRLRDMAAGYVPDLDQGSRTQLWDNIILSIYQERLRVESTRLILYDTSFCFVSPLWKQQLGTVRVVVPLVSPAISIQCLSLTQNISAQDSLQIYIFYFELMLQSLQAYDLVSFVKYNTHKNYVGQVSSHDHTMDDSPDHMSATFSCDLTQPIPDKIFDIVPLWLDSCVESAIRYGSAAECNMPT